MAVATKGFIVEAGFDGEDHARLDEGGVAEVEEGGFVVAQADGVADVVFPVGHEVVLVVVGADGAVHFGAGEAGLEGADGKFLEGKHVVEEAFLGVSGGADDHGAFEFGVVAPYGGAGTGDEDVAGLEGDVGSKGVGDGGVAPNLAAIARTRAVGEIALGTVERADGIEHGEGGFVAGALGNFGFGEAGAGIALEERMSQVGPLDTFFDEGDLGGGFDHHLVFDKGIDRMGRVAGEFGEAGAAVAEDPGVTVVIRTKSAVGGPHIQ